MPQKLGVRLNQFWLESTVYNVFNMLWDGAGEAPYDELALELRGVFSEFLTMFSDDWVFNGITVRDFNLAPPFTVEAPLETPLVGTNASPNMPTQCAAMTRTTAVDSPPNRGRIYWSGSTTGNLAANGRVTPGARANFDAMTQALADGLPLTGGTCKLVIARVNFATNDWTLWNEIDGILTVSPWGIQRRRRPGSGI